jgi:hypothetical protein
MQASMTLSEAAANGQMSVVKFLVESAHVDLDAPGPGEPSRRLRAMFLPVCVSMRASGSALVVPAAASRRRVAVVVNVACARPLTHTPLLLGFRSCADGTTPLCAAALWGDDAMVKFLIGEGASVNARNAGACSPYRIVCRAW